MREPLYKCYCVNYQKACFSTNISMLKGGAIPWDPWMFQNSRQLGMLRSKLQSGQPVIFSIWVGLTRADWKMVSDAMWFQFTQPGFSHVWEWPLSHTVFKGFACQTCPSKCSPTISWRTVGNFNTFNQLCYSLTLYWLYRLILSAISIHGL